MKHSRMASIHRASWTALVATLVVGFCSLSPNVSLANAASGNGDDDKLVMPDPIFVTAQPAPLTSSTFAIASTATTDGEPLPTTAEQIVVLVNQFRVQNGLPPLKLNAALTKSGQDFVARQGSANFFGHNDPDFGCNSSGDRDLAAGYTHSNYVGENLAAGYSSPESAFAAWTQSAGHRANLLNTNYREIGVGYAEDADDAANVRVGSACPYANNGGPYRYYWSQEFGSRFVNGLPHLPVIINGEAVTTTRRAVTLYVYGGDTWQPSWAKQMRFSDDGKNWTNYEAWASTRVYTLPAGVGIKTVYAQITDGSNTQTVTDTIYLSDGSVGTPILEPSPTATAVPNPTATPNPMPKMPIKTFLPVIKR